MILKDTNEQLYEKVYRRSMTKDIELPYSLWELFLPIYTLPCVQQFSNPEAIQTMFSKDVNGGFIK